MDYTTLETNICAWLPSRPDIRAAAVIGSRGRSAGYRADASADYDLLLVSTTPERYQHTSWLSAFGPVVSAVFDPSDHVAFAGSLDFFTVYKDGCDADVSLLAYAYVQQLIHDAAARERDLVHLITPTLAKGFRPLFDPEQLLSQLALVFPADLMRFVPPDGAAFADAVENFWQGVVKIAKKLRAGRLYAAQRWYNAQRQDVIQMVEWHARLTRDLPGSTWYRDKYLEQWADPRVIAALPQLYAAYEVADLRRAFCDDGPVSMGRT
jgi:Streptomycin adenylyltransferase